jgi:phosphohistidine phosphatase
MELLLWRHADAVDDTPDHARKLSKFGGKQAKIVADWLTKHAPKDARLLASPTTRTRQTAGFFREKMEIREALASSAAADEILALLDWPNAQTPVIVVGHQPMLGEIAKRLLPEGGYRGAFGKGELWWFSGKQDGQAILRVRINPNDKILPEESEAKKAPKQKQEAR